MKIREGKWQLNIMEDIILLGSGGHAHSVVDSIEQVNQYHVVGFLDVAEKQENSYKGYQVCGTDDDLRDYYLEGVKNAFVAIGYMGNNTVRFSLYKRLKEIGFNIPNIIDITAIVADDVVLEDGIFIGKRAVVNTNSVIKRMSIINTGAIIEHDCFLGEYSHLAVGGILCGGVSVGTRTLIGANATVIQNIKIGNDVIVGAGTVIAKDLRDNIVKYGNMEKERNENNP